MFSRIKKTISEFKELRYLAYHDSLTGLLNRNWLYKNIEYITHKYVYFIDINNLKEVNKKGHMVGDQYIKNIVNLFSIYSSSRITIRFGGDEFLIFSNTKLPIYTSKEFAVGMAINYGNINMAINNADINMIMSKERLKINEL